MPQQTSNSIANQAIQLIGDNQPAVTGFAPTFDTSTAGLALAQIYAPTVAAMQRRWAWDASRRQVSLVASGNAGPFPLGFSGEYVYPANGIEVWQLRPTVLADANNPSPVNWVDGNTLVGGVQTKVIWTSVPAPLAIYNNNPSEATWDALFTEAVVREIASKLAIAIAGRPDTSRVQMQIGEGAMQANQTREG